MENHKVSIYQWLTLFLLGGVWGSSFILMKIGARAYSTIEVSSLRMFFGGVLVMPFLFYILKKYDRKIILWMCVSALLGSAIPSLFYSYSAKRMDSNLNGVINSLTPLFTLLVGVVWLKNRVSNLSLAGIVVGFLGIVLLFTHKGATMHQANYAIFPLLATMMYGINMNIVKVKLSHLPSQDILLGVFSIIGWVYLPIILYLDVFRGIDWSIVHLNFWEKTTSIELQRVQSLIALIILGVVGSMAASFLFYRLLKRTSALFASTNTYLIPLMSIFWGYMDGESIGWTHFVSLVIILIGVFLVSKRK